jgi:TrmH family RNA methyltransferase
MTVISSRANPLFKRLRNLARDARVRSDEQCTLLDGTHLIESYCAQGGKPELFVVSDSGSRHPEIKTLIQRYPQTQMIQCTDAIFSQLAVVKSPMGILAVISLPAAPPFEAIHPEGDAVFLDRIQDAGNMGALLRCAAAAGVGDVVCGPGCAHVWSPRVLRGAQGAHFALRVHICADPVATLDALMCRGFSAIAAVAGEGEDVFDLPLLAPQLWIFGNEGTGVDPMLCARAHRRATIPLVGQESLNVSAAAAVCLFESRRQKRLQCR